MRSQRQKKQSFNFTGVFAAVIGLHLLVGGGGLWLAKTQAGKEFARVYNVTIFEPPKPAEEAKVEPPPPPPVEEAPAIEAPAMDTPAVSAPAASLASAVEAAPAIGSAGAGGGINWEGKFAGAGAFDGPEGAFHAAVTGRFRKYYREPSESFGAASLELQVGGQGSVESYRLVKSSGNPTNDQAILTAASRIQAEGVGIDPPENRGRVVTVRFVPSS